MHYRAHFHCANCASPPPLVTAGVAWCTSVPTSIFWCTLPLQMAVCSETSSTTSLLYGVNYVIVTSEIIYPEVDVGSCEVELPSPSKFRGSRDPNALLLFRWWLHFPQIQSSYLIGVLSTGVTSTLVPQSDRVTVPVLVVLVNPYIARFSGFALVLNPVRLVVYLGRTGWCSSSFLCPCFAWVVTVLHPLADPCPEAVAWRVRAGEMSEPTTPPESGDL